MRFRFLLMLCFFVSLVSVSSPRAAQLAAGEESKTQSDAAAAYDAKDWAKAAKLYEEMAAAHPEIPRLWYRLGISEQGLHDFDKALAHFQKALDAGLAPIFGEYAIASVYAQKGDKDAAFAHLRKALDAGYNDPDSLNSDERFASIRQDSQFAALMKIAVHNMKPCSDTPENRQFDFWLGEWNVESTQGGIPAGQSRIELILGDCVVQENWQSNGNPYSGKSYNIYNSSLKRWEQYWVDNSGGNIFFHGALKDGVMDYWTDDVPQPDGTKLTRHLQFIPQGPDQVRQFSQGSTDGGKSWHVEYDFTYKRKK
ncbi:MAG TPA: tetratricopeptide repeat protein [Candidatus Acidoferrales bacterium]|nr:tetratricopeptide repeat protein [Candidatus Acidoferrales bacterium]